MASPLTAFAAVASFVSGVVGATGQIYAGRQERLAGEYNAQIEENQAEIIRLESQEQSIRQRAFNEEFLGHQVARRAAQGVDVQSGSALLVHQESASRLELAVLEGQRQSRNEAFQARSRAQMHRFQGDVAKDVSKLRAGESLLRGAGQAAAILV